MIHPAYAIIALLTLSACGFFGEFDQQRFSQERCVGDATKFACTERIISLDPQTGTVGIELVNGVGETVEIDSVSTNDYSSCGIEKPSFSLIRDGTDVTGQPLEANDEFTLRVECEPQPSGKTFDETFTIHFSIIDGISNLQGTIETVVLT